MGLVKFISGLGIGFVIGSSWGILNARQKGYKVKRRLRKIARKHWKNATR